MTWRVFFGCSCTEEQMKARVELGLRTYHETLLAEGVATYSFDELNRDFNQATWHACTIPCFGGKMLSLGRKRLLGAKVVIFGLVLMMQSMTQLKEVNYLWLVIGSVSGKIIFIWKEGPQH